MHGAMPPQSAVVLQVKRLHPDEPELLLLLLLLEPPSVASVHAPPCELSAFELQSNVTPFTHACCPQSMFLLTPL